MTTANTTMPPDFPRPVRMPSDFEGYVLIPLSEFGLSLDSPGLGVWLEGIAGRNKDAVGDFEITARGELKIMSPIGIPGDFHQTELMASVGRWAWETGGRPGGPTSAFWLVDGSLRGPDAYWFSAERWSGAPMEARQPPFVAITPDFLAEIVSRSNRGAELENKVQVYLQGGARLVWVINARLRRVTIYRPGAEPEILQDPDVLGGGDVLPGFAFNVRQRIFDNDP